LSDAANNLVVTAIAKGATAQLREVIEHADRETARPIYDELLRLAYKLAWKHEFVRSVREAKKHEHSRAD